MATKLGIVTGNLTAAGTWVTGDTGTNATLLSTSASTTALTTSNQDSATFTLTAAAMQWILLRIGSRAAGSPTNKITITLVNSTAPGLRVPSAWVVNVSDLPACTTAADDGGYILLKASATWTPNGTDVYLVRMVLDNTTTAVSFCTNGTAANWQRVVGVAATSAPTTGDDMHVAAIFDNTANPATRTTINVTDDSTTATDYGSANTSYRIPAMAISAGSIISGITASTVYVTQLSGWQVVFVQGTLNAGTSGSPVPRGTGSRTYQYDCVADNDFGLSVRNGTCTGQGLSRTSGKNVVWTLLTADVAAAGTAMAVADDTGWLNGDTCAVASTSRTATDAESFTLNGNAGASSLTASAGLGFAHKGSTAEKMQAEVVLLTRQVIFKSVSTTALSTVQILSGAQCDFDWVLFQNMGGSTAGNIAIDVQITTGTCTFDYCALQTCEFTGWKISGAVNGGTVALRHCVGYSLLQTSTSGIGFVHLSTTPTTTGITIDDCVGIGDTTINGFAPVRMSCADMSLVTLTNIRMSSFGGSSGVGVTFDTVGDHKNTTVGPFYLHSGGSGGLLVLAVNTQRLKIDTVYAWRSTASGIEINGTLNDIQFIGTTVCYGNTTTGVEVDTSACVVGLVFADLRCYGDTTFGQTSGMQFDGGKPFFCRVLTGDFGTAAGLWTTHSTADLNFSPNGSTGSAIDILFNNTNLASGTPISGFSSTASDASMCRLRFAYLNRSPTTHKVMTKWGDVLYETGTVDVSPSIKMTPNSTVSKLDTSGLTPGREFLIPVDSGQNPTISIKIQKDGSYNGNAPRLIAKSNAGIGITADTVLGTYSGSAGSFQVVSGSPGAVTAAGLIPVVVDCDGTAGNIFVDSLSVTGAGVLNPGALPYWVNGAAAAMVANASGGSGTGGLSRSRVIGGV